MSHNMRMNYFRRDDRDLKFALLEYVDVYKLFLRES